MNRAIKSPFQTTFLPTKLYTTAPMQIKNDIAASITTEKTKKKKKR
jgi:hypothetical protein